jgi:hypothetical protein
VKAGLKRASDRFNDPTPPLNSKKKKLTDFWGKETQEERAERVQREFETLRLDRETRQLKDSQEKLVRLQRKRDNDRKRQQKHRDFLRQKKRASGWVPGRKKRVS